MPLGPKGERHPTDGLVPAFKIKLTQQRILASARSRVIVPTLQPVSAIDLFSD